MNNTNNKIPLNNYLHVNKNNLRTQKYKKIYLKNSINVHIESNFHPVYNKTKRYQYQCLNFEFIHETRTIRLCCKLSSVIDLIHHKNPKIKYKHNLENYKIGGVTQNSSSHQ